MKIGVCEHCKKETQLYAAKHGLRGKYYCLNCQRKILKEQKMLGLTKPNLVR